MERSRSGGNVDRASTRSLDGLRAMLNLWIMAFHALFCIMTFLPEQEVKTLFGANPLLEHGYIAVDGFMALTGYLMALPLLQRAEITSMTLYERLQGYYVSRFSRIMIPYAGLILLHCVIINRTGTFLWGLVRLQPALASYDMFFPGVEQLPNGCDTSWANLLHIANFMPYNGCFIHSWSVGVQYHAYLWLPLLWHVFHLHKSSNMARVTGVACSIAAVSRFIAQLHHSSGFNHGIVGSALELFNYSNSINRVHVIVIGMLAAHLSVRADVVAWLRSPSARSTRLAAYALIVAYFTLNLQWRAWVGDYRYERGIAHSLFVTCISVGTPLSAAAWCAIIIMLAHKIGVAADDSLKLSTVLSAATLARMAEYSYWAYLIHPLVFNTVFSHPWLLYPAASNDARPWSLIHGASGVERTNASFVVESPLLRAVYDARDVVFPHGESTLLSDVLLYTLFASCLTYAASYVLIHAFELPLRSALQTAVSRGKCAQRTIMAYSGIVMLVGVLVHVAGTVAVVALIRPQHEDWVQQTYNGTATAVQAALDVDGNASQLLR